MCVTRPAEVLDVAGATARVLWQGQPLEVDVSLVGPVAARGVPARPRRPGAGEGRRDEAAGLTALLAEWAGLTAPDPPISPQEGGRDA